VARCLRRRRARRSAHRHRDGRSRRRIVQPDNCVARAVRIVAPGVASVGGRGSRIGLVGVDVHLIVTCVSVIGGGGACLAPRTRRRNGGDRWRRTCLGRAEWSLSGHGDRPHGMYLHPSMIGVQHVWSGHRHLCIQRWRRDIRAGADAVRIAGRRVGSWGQSRWLPGSAAGLVGRDNLGHEVVVFVGDVRLVEQVGLPTGERKIDVNVAVVLATTISDRSGDRYAVPDDVQAVGVVHVCQRVTAAAQPAGGTAAGRRWRLLGCLQRSPSCLRSSSSLRAGRRCRRRSRGRRDSGLSA
jgi:hypothetical protein